MFSIFPFDETARLRWPSCVDVEGNDCLAIKGFSLTHMQLAAGATVHVYNLHMDAGGTPEDDDARDLGIDALLDVIAEMSDGAALIVAGDFNLHTDREPASTQFARLLDAAGLQDACTERDCERPGSIDKFLFRSSDAVTIEAQSWRLETDVFVSDMDEPLSDHDPLAVRFAWAAAD
jgi:endonuclease/exonuclease/phosphatase family metal-dependent hydrolase